MTILIENSPSILLLMGLLGLAPAGSASPWASIDHHEILRLASIFRWRIFAVPRTEGNNAIFTFLTTAVDVFGGGSEIEAGVPPPPL